MPTKLKPFTPVISEMPAQTMAVVVTKGDPNVIGAQVFPALYGAVFTLKFQLKKSGQGDFKVTGLRARWPDLHTMPKDQWTGLWALPIPDGWRPLRLGTGTGPVCTSPEA